MKRNALTIKMVFATKLLLALLMLVFMGRATDVHAEEDFKYNIINSFAEFEDYVISGEPTHSLPDATAENTFKLEVKEPGYLIIQRMYVQDGTNDGYGYYSVDRTKGNSHGKKLVWGEFTDSLLTSNKLNAISPISSKLTRLDSTIYSNTYKTIYYLDKGIYYFVDENEEYQFPGDSSYFNYYEDKNLDILFFSAFLPSSVQLSIESISYNDDYSEAHVSFKHLVGKVSEVRVANSKVNGWDKINTSSGWDYIYRENSYTNWGTTYESADDFINNGMTIKDNGDYSVYFKSTNASYADYPVCINFTIENIGKVVEAKSVKLNKKKATLTVNKKISLKATVKPSDTTDKTITWKTSNKKVATVDKNGKVTAKKKGTCVITAVTSNGKKAKCKITVKN